MSINLQTDITSRPPARKGRRHFIGGSDARIIMGANEDALLRLWREKRGEVEPEDLSANLVVQLGVVTEAAQSDLVRAQYGTDHHGYPAVGPPPREPVDGRHARRHDPRNRRRVRGQVHAAVVVLGRSGRRKAHGAAAAQHVGDQRQVGVALDHHRRRQMGRDHHSRRCALSAFPDRPPSESSGAASNPANLRDRSASNPHCLESRR